MGRYVTTGEPTVVVVGAGYEGKRRCYERLAAIGARMVIVDEPGHWSESLVDEFAGTKWIAAPITGDPDVDAEAILDALERSAVRADGVLTFWEDSVCEAARVAAALGLPATRRRRSTRRAARSAPGSYPRGSGCPPRQPSGSAP